MGVLRLVVVAVALIALSVAPLLWGPARQVASAETVYASTGPGRTDGESTVRQDNDDDEDDDGDDDNDNADDDGEDNDNQEDEDNDNADDGQDNDNDDDDDNDNADDDGHDNDNADDDGDDNDNDNVEPAPASGPVAGATMSSAARCYDAGASGAIDLHLASGGVTLNVVPASTFPEVTDVSLSAVDPASVASPPGPVLGDLIFNVRALSGCGGGERGQLPSAVNLGVAYSVPANASNLQIAVWNGTSWTDVQTVPDPSNPFISATVQQTGTYAVYQR